MWEMGIEPRYWFRRTPCRDRLSGHFVGIYAMSGKYDFQWRESMCYQGEFWSAGITYGYSMPLGGLFNLELSVSLGWLQSDYVHYNPSAGWEELIRDRDRQGTLGYFGPTKLKASLVLPLSLPLKNREEVRHE